MAKKISKNLKKSILKALGTATEPLPTDAIAERIADDPGLSRNQHKTPSQVAYILKQLQREFPALIEETPLGTNGISQHGKVRTKNGFHAPTLAMDFLEEVLEKKVPGGMKQLTVNLPPECIEYLAHRKERDGLSPGRVFEELIKTDMAVQSDGTE